jgi:hypothetical protein
VPLGARFQPKTGEAVLHRGGGVVSAVVPDPGHPQVVAEVAAAALGERSPRSRFRVGGGGEREEG